MNNKLLFVQTYLSDKRKKRLYTLWILMKKRIRFAILSFAN